MTNHILKDQQRGLVCAELNDLVAVMDRETLDRTGVGSRDILMKAKMISKISEPVLPELFGNRLEFSDGGHADILLSEHEQQNKSLDLIAIPDVRQSVSFSCGAAVLRSVCEYFGVGPESELDYIDLLGTDRTGTPPEAIVAAAEKLGLSVQAGSMDMASIAAPLAEGKPIIAVCQSNGDGDREGHYVVLIGESDQSVYVHDPAAGRKRIGKNLWQSRWHDVGKDGTEYRQWGAVIGKSGPVTKDSYFEDCPRDDEGHCLPSGQTKPGATERPAAAEKPKPEKPAGKKPKLQDKPVAPPPEGKMQSEKSKRAKAAHKMVDKRVQRYAEEYNEPRFAKLVGGVSHPDSEPMDVTTKNGDLVELKTMVLQRNKEEKITMDKYSQVRKIVKEQETGQQFHTVVSDDRGVVGSLEDESLRATDESARVYYYRRGVAGPARIASLYRCKDEAELKRVMAMPEDKLPDGAARTDKKLRVGKWEFFTDEKGKGFRNDKTGKVARPKK